MITDSGNLFPRVSLSLVGTETTGSVRYPYCSNYRDIPSVWSLFVSPLGYLLFKWILRPSKTKNGGQPSTIFSIPLLLTWQDYAVYPRLSLYLEKCSTRLIALPLQIRLVQVGLAPLER